MPTKSFLKAVAFCRRQLLLYALQLYRKAESPLDLEEPNYDRWPAVSAECAAEELRRYGGSGGAPHSAELSGWIERYAAGAESTPPFCLETALTELPCDLQSLNVRERLTNYVDDIERCLQHLENRAIDYLNEWVTKSGDWHDFWCIYVELTHVLRRELIQREVNWS